MSESNWVSVKDFLPPENKNVLARVLVSSEEDPISDYYVKYFEASVRRHPATPIDEINSDYSVWYLDTSPIESEDFYYTYFVVTHWLPIPNFYDFISLVEKKLHFTKLTKDSE
jgi:hypothetical protein